MGLPEIQILNNYVASNLESTEHKKELHKNPSRTRFCNVASTKN